MILNINEFFLLGMKDVSYGIMRCRIYSSFLLFCAALDYVKLMIYIYD